MKKVFTLAFVVMFSFILTDSVYASENDNDLNLDLSKSEIIYQDDEITVGSFGNDPEIADEKNQVSTG